ncbi:hypothetical protein F511_13444 [Dorcoceras hygrometricum]|uniref:Uncharacterized protein n=1 Tax=Dorcoceras hygrometricum TaxID=472368 RepID=A0A2Z7AFM0_9LAMI|nr:hypothetical protein F511_13444 [Dorcoceras hygrometricum]
MDFSRWCISERPAVASDKLLVCYCDDQQRALRDFEETTFYNSDENESGSVGLLSLRFPGFTAGRGYDPAGGAPGGG